MAYLLAFLNIRRKLSTYRSLEMVFFLCYTEDSLMKNLLSRLKNKNKLYAKRARSAAYYQAAGESQKV